jgi:hypothetical protein
MLFNYFGANKDTIISSYGGVPASDFASTTDGVSSVNIYSSDTILTQELDLAEGMLLDKMGNGLLHTFEFVENLRPLYDLASNTFTIPVQLPMKNELRVWKLAEGYDRGYCGTNPGSYSGYYSDGYYYSFENPELESFQITDLTPIAVTISGQNFSIDNYTYNKDDVVICEYRVDTSAINIQSLKSTVRDIVAGNMGSQLYSSAQPVWAQVEVYNTRANKALDSIDDYWMPGELKRMKWWRLPVKVKGGIYSTRILRG